MATDPSTVLIDNTYENASCPSHRIKTVITSHQHSYLRVFAKPSLRSMAPTLTCILNEIIPCRFTSIFTLALRLRRRAPRGRGSDRGCFTFVLAPPCSALTAQRHRHISSAIIRRHPWSAPRTCRHLKFSRMGRRLRFSRCPCGGYSGYSGTLSRPLHLPLHGFDRPLHIAS